MLTLGQKITFISDYAYSDGGASATVNIFIPLGSTGTIVELPDELNEYHTVLLDTQYACLEAYANHLSLMPDELCVIA